MLPPQSATESSQKLTSTLSYTQAHPTRATKTPSPTSDYSPALIGTPLPENPEPISADNLHRIEKVAQWGKGNILGAVFAPDGKYFLVGSSFGIAVYDVRELDTPPDWIPLDIPFWYEDMYISSDGSYLLLENRDEQ